MPELLDEIDHLDSAGDRQGVHGRRRHPALQELCARKRVKVNPTPVALDERA